MKFQKLYSYVDSVCEKLPDGELRESFKKCYLNTLETTVKYDENGEVFIITGDIEAMWLRDSSVQVSHYVRLAGEDEDCKVLVKDLLHRQFRYIIEDPYANAFNECANGKGHRDDITKQNDLVFERKYEIDSLIYPLWLAEKYYKYTNDSGIFDELFFEAFDVIIKTLKKEQDPFSGSDYTFLRPRIPEDSLDNGGKGTDYAFTGLVRSAFRPSDDRCKYPFLIPSNMFIVSALESIKKCLGNRFGAGAEELLTQVKAGIEKYAVVTKEGFGKIYAYETDGLGSYLLMDDANVPSLLSLPYLGYCGEDDEIYRNTRRFILSKGNPYYFEGTNARGIGSPHTKSGNIWHIALIMESLTCSDKAEAERILSLLRTTNAGTGFMHESFNCCDPSDFTRDWFAWANTLFAIFIIDKII